MDGWAERGAGGRSRRVVGRGGSWGSHRRKREFRWAFVLRALRAVLRVPFVPPHPRPPGRARSARHVGGRPSSCGGARRASQQLWSARRASQQLWRARRAAAQRGRRRMPSYLSVRSQSRGACWMSRGCRSPSRRQDSGARALRRVLRQMSSRISCARMLGTS